MNFLQLKVWFWERKQVKNLSPVWIKDKSLNDNYWNKNIIMVCGLSLIDNHMHNYSRLIFEKEFLKELLFLSLVEKDLRWLYNWESLKLVKLSLRIVK